MALSASQLGKDMLAAFSGKLKDQWPDIKDYAKTEAKKLAETLVMIEKLHIAGSITDEQAKLHLDIQKNSTRIVLLALEGLGLLAVEAAINAALDVVKNAVNTALDFTLI